MSGTGLGLLLLGLGLKWLFPGHPLGRGSALILRNTSFISEIYKKILLCAYAQCHCVCAVWGFAASL